LLRPEHAKVLKVFQEAVSWGKGGEVVLRCGPDTGRVFFAEGRIAWATVSTIEKTFTQYLVEQTDLGEEEAREAFEDCKRTGKNFGETVVEWGLIDESTLRQLLLQHMSACLLEIFCWPDVESMFMPDEKPYKGSLTFDFMEILQTVLILDAEGRLPFKGLSAAQILDELEKEEVTQTAAPAFPETTAVEPSPQGMRPPTVPAVSPLSGELEIVEEPVRTEPILLTEVKKKKGWGGLILFFVLVIIAAGVVAAYFFRDRLFGEPEAKPPEPEPMAAAPAEEPQPAIDAGQEPDETEDAGDAADQPADAALEPEPEPEPRPGIVAFAEGRGIGSIRVISKPRKARIYLDGVNTGKLTPATLENVPAKRRHVILVEKQGRHPAFGVVDLEADQKAFANLNLRRRGPRLKGRISVRVESEPPGASIFIEGGKLKKKTPTVARLRADRSVRIEVVKSGYEKWVRTVRPVAGMDITILVKLQKQ
jgi:hypothetical protein